jgi:hypothetical protein
MTKSEVKKLERRVGELTRNGDSEGPALTTEERNMVGYFWFNLHKTPHEAAAYAEAEQRQQEIHDAAGSVYLSTEQNAEYERLAKLQVQIGHDIVPKRMRVNETMYNRILPELAPRVLRYWKLKEKPVDELTDAEAQELEGLLEWFDKLQAEALESAESQLAKTSSTSGSES